MDSKEFRQHAHEFVDWMADYLEGVEALPVRSQVAPGEIAAKLPEAPPEGPESMDVIFADFKRDVLPGVTHWQHPSFFAYFPANSSPPSVLAEMLTATMGAQCMMWQTSPAATEMETCVLDWLRQMLGLPEGFVGTIQDSASSATLCAILTARERATGWRVNRNGLASEAPLVVYCSEETHSAVEKGAKIAGLGAANVRKLPVDESFAMRAEALDRAITEDTAAGRVPACVVATLGATGSGGIDPLRPISEICHHRDVFLHIDAAWAGSALILPEYRWMIEGIEAVDSFVFNPHKWLMTNFDCSAHYVRDPEALIRTLTILPEFLKGPETGTVIDYRDWGVPLGRRFRALKLWFVIRSYGVSGLREILKRHIALAREAEAELAAEPDFEILAPARLALFCFRYHPKGVDEPARLDAMNQALLSRLNDSGRLYLTQTRLRGATVIRFQVGQTRTDRRHVAAALDLIRETARALSVEPTAPVTG